MIDFNKVTTYDDLTHDDLQSHANSCFDCDLHEDRQNVVFYSGNTNANLMLIGEGPGQQEDEEGVPFIGRAGKLLTKILESVEINRNDIYIANTVKCRPPKNRTPLPTEMDACRDYLIRQIQIVQPKIICLLGAAAMKSILGPTESITKIRGQWITANVEYMSDELYIMPIFHPSYLLRNASKDKGAPKWLTWQDMKEVKAALSFYDIMA